MNGPTPFSPVFLAENSDLLRGASGDIWGGLGFGEVPWGGDAIVLGHDYTRRCVVMHPPAGSCWADFAIPQHMRFFQSSVGLIQQIPYSAGSRFKVATAPTREGLSQGHLPAEAAIVGGNAMATLRFEFPADHRFLRLTTVSGAPDSNYGNHAAWLNPNFSAV